MPDVAAAKQDVYMFVIVIITMVMANVTVSKLVDVVVLAEDVQVTDLLL